MSKRPLLLTLFLFSLIFSSFAYCEQNILIFLGPPGAGKGVLCKKLSKESLIPHISTGEMLREEQANQNSPMAIELSEYIKEGQLVPDEMIVRILMRRINKPDCKNGFILDGFPRTLSQAHILEKSLPSQANLIVVNLKVDDATIVKRLLGRRICSKCQQPYHVDFFPPAKKGACDHCKNKLITRNDDCEVSIRNRLEIFKDQHGPIEDYYKNRHEWVEINAANPVESNYSTLLEKVNAVNLDFLIDFPDRQTH